MGRLVRFDSVHGSSTTVIEFNAAFLTHEALMEEMSEVQRMVCMCVYVCLCAWVCLYAARCSAVWCGVVKL